MAPPGGGAIAPSMNQDGASRLTAEQRNALTRLGPDRWRRWVLAGRRSVDPR